MKERTLRADPVGTTRRSRRRRIRRQRMRRERAHKRGALHAAPESIPTVHRKRPNDRSGRAHIPSARRPPKSSPRDRSTPSARHDTEPIQQRLSDTRRSRSREKAASRRCHRDPEIRRHVASNTAPRGNPDSDARVRRPSGRSHPDRRFLRLRR